jgi:prenyltransferase beta subunit
VDFTTFGIFALWAAGESARSTRVKKAARWLTDQQETDGGFATNQFAPSDLDDTGAALQALAAAGYAASHPNVGRALHYLADAQTPSGGFPLMGGGPANAESTAYALQGSSPRPRWPRQRTASAILSSRAAGSGWQHSPVGG